MFGLKPPLYYLPGKAPSDAAASPPHSLSPHSGVSPRGSPQPGDSPLSAPASASQGRFGGEVTFFHHLIEVLGSGEGGRGGSREPWHGTAVFWGAWIPLSSPAATPSPWGFLPLPEEPGAFWPRQDGQKCGMRCVLGWGSLLAAPSLRGHGDLGHQSLLCHPSRQLQPPRQPAREGDPPGGVWGASVGLGRELGGCVRGVCSGVGFISAVLLGWGSHQGDGFGARAA